MNLNDKLADQALFSTSKIKLTALLLLTLSLLSDELDGVLRIA